MQLSQYTIEQLIKGVEKLEIYPNEIQEAIEREQKPLYWIEQFHKAACVAMVGYAMTAKQYSGAVDEALQELEAILERLVIAGGVCSNSNIQAFAMGNAAKVQAVRNAIAPDRKQHPQEQSTDNATATGSPLILPDGLHTDEAIKVFEAAIKAGYITKQGDCYKWNKTNALLAYMCGRLYCGDSIEKSPITKDWEYKKGGYKDFPETAICTLFNVKNLGQSRRQMERPPKGYTNIDRLF